MSRDAFISYARNPDEDFAPALHGGLQALGKPWNKRRALDVFLDKAGLEASSSLGDSLQRDLEGARYLVVLASTGLANSHWCGEEIKHWLATTGSADRLLLGLTDGEIGWNNDTGDFDWEITTALPRESMSGVFDDEPLWVDFRDIKQTDPGALDVRAHQGFEDLVATIGAPIHGISKDELVGRDLAEFKKSKRLRRVAIVALTILTVVAGVAAVIASNQQREAVKQRNEADRQRVIAVENEELAIANEEIAVENAEIAQREAREARARELAAASFAVIEEDPELGILLALESVATTAETDGYVLLASQQALHDTIAESGARNRFGVFAPWTAEEGYSYVGAIDFNETGDAVAASLADGDIALFERPGHGSPYDQTAHFDVGSPITRIRPLDDSPLVSTQDLGVLWLDDGIETVIEGSDQVAVTPDLTVIGVDRDGQTIEVPFDDGEPALDAARFGPVHPEIFDNPERSRVNDLAVDYLGQRVASINDDGYLGIWSVGSSQFQIHQQIEFFDPCLSVTWLGLNRVAVGCGYGQIYVFDVDEEVEDGAREVAFLQGHTGSVHRLTATPDGKWLVSGSADWTVRVWETSTYQEVRMLAGHGAQVTDVATNLAGDRIGSVAQDGTVVLWEREPGEVAWQFMDNTTQSDHTISFTDSGSIVTWATNLVDVDLAGDAVVAYTDAEYVTTQALGDQVVVGDFEGNVVVDGIAAPFVHPDRVLDIATGGGRVASVSNTSVFLWDTRTGEAIELIEGEEGDAWTAVALNPDGTILAAGNDDATVVVFDVTDPSAPEVVFDETTVGVTDLALHPTLPIFALAVEDGAVRLWSYEDAIEIARLAGHRDWVLSVAFSPDGSRLVSGGSDQTVRVWDVESNDELLLFNTHGHRVTAVAWSPDGTTIASANEGGHLQLHHVEITELVGLAESRVFRDMTEEECLFFLGDACSSRGSIDVSGLPVVEAGPEN